MISPKRTDSTKTAILRTFAILYSIIWNRISDDAKVAIKVAPVNTINMIESCFRVRKPDVPNIMGNSNRAILILKMRNTFLWILFE